MGNRQKYSAGALLTQGGMIAALYVVLTLASAAFGLASNPVQLRLSEALTLLPCFFPGAVPGLFVGCLLANLLTGSILWDVIVGSLATLLGALGTRLLRKNRWLAMLPPIVSNLLLVPPVLAWAYRLEGSIPFFMLTVGAGEILSCGVLGQLMYTAICRRSPGRGSR